MTKYTELWDKTKNLIEKINGEPGEHEKGFIKIKLDSDDDLILGKILSLHNMAIVVRSVFQEDNKYYLQIFLDECYSTKELIFRYWYFKDISYKFEPYICNKCHDIQ